MLADLHEIHNTDTKERLRELKVRSVTENVCMNGGASLWPAGLSLSPGLDLEVICSIRRLLTVLIDS